MKKLTIGLIGNPNSGKTTLFNQLTGSRQRVGNWAGVTVERKEGQFSTTDHQVTLVDLPGTYSLTTISSQTSLDEQIACHYILSGDADLLINVVDASNLERNLYLTLQLLVAVLKRSSWRLIAIKLTKMWNWCITLSRCSTKQIHWQK